MAIQNMITKSKRFMATSLFKVKVLSKKEASLILRLRIISAEQPGFCTSKSFALMLLIDPIIQEIADRAPLAHNVSLKDTLDINWVSVNVSKYIEECHLSNIENYPLSVDLEQLSPKQQRDFWKSNRTPTAIFEITTTSPAWIEHIDKGMEWDTAAFDLVE